MCIHAKSTILFSDHDKCFPFTPTMISISFMMSFLLVIIAVFTMQHGWWMWYERFHLLGGTQWSALYPRVGCQEKRSKQKSLYEK